MEKQSENLIQSAWQICNLINELNDLLWERYGDAFIQIYLQEEDQKFLRTLGVPKGEEEDPSD